MGNVEDTQIGAAIGGSLVRPRDEERAARLWLVGCVAATAIIALASNGAYHDDDLKHYLFARWTRYDPQYLTHTWGRPGFTLLYALPAQLGWWACRLVSVALSGLTAWATFRAAQALGLRRASWTVPLVYAQPLFLHLATTTLTETAAATYLALATWALLAGRPRLSAAVFSLTMITRHEAVVLLPVWAWAIWAEAVPALPPFIGGGWTLRKALAFARIRWPALALLVWAPIVYNAATWLVFGYLPGEVFSRPDGAVHYGRGTPLTFMMRFVVMAGPVVATLFVVGCRALWAERRARPLLIGVIVYVAAETALYMFQAYATGGYARFLVPVAPWVAIVALGGVLALVPVSARQLCRPFGALSFPAPITQGLRPGLLSVAPTGLETNEFRQAETTSGDHDWQSHPPQPPLMKGGSGRPALLWLGAAIVLWLCVEIERAANPIPAIAPWFWLFRLGAILFVAGIAAPLLFPRGHRICAAAVALALLGPAARAAWPHRLRPREAVIADAVAVLRERGLLDRPFYSTSDWSYYFAGRWYPARHPPLYEELRSAPPGSLLVWEARYGPSPDFNLQLDALRADPRWREIHASAPDAAGGSFVHVFECDCARLSALRGFAAGATGGGASLCPRLLSCQAFGLKRAEGDRSCMCLNAIVQGFQP